MCKITGGAIGDIMVEEDIIGANNENQFTLTNYNHTQHHVSSRLYHWTDIQSNHTNLKKDVSAHLRIKTTSKAIDPGKGRGGGEREAIGQITYFPLSSMHISSLTSTVSSDRTTPFSYI